MKKCKCCGARIENGVNGCALAGDICFTCRPWNMGRIVPARRREVPDYEGAILARQDAAE